ncbi:MAG: hypothetical protein LBT43_22880 [Prevotella sp.]|jgi:S-DNA-T family DNA segregation ATPase FtsK/SpoIIIE|nr:hypothetical protein [Prevotella sp.]
MGIFSFFRKKKAVQTTFISESTLEKVDEVDNTEFVPDEVVLIIEDSIECVETDESISLYEETEPEIYEELADYDPTKDLSDYRLPSIGLLKVYEPIDINTEEAEGIKAKIVSILQISNIEIISISVNVGYVNTLYEIIPKAGFRISKIKQLKTDLAFALLVPQLTIEPIMERGVIGIIVPNKDFQILPLQALVASRKFQESDFSLPLVLGRTMKVEDFIVDLITQPHILIAGATGQGKSVLLNNIITSLLYKKYPTELKLVLIDTHILEFNLYSRIENHYLAKLPDSEQAVISDVYKAEQTLKALCKEMDDRYELLFKSGTKNIRDYNQKFKIRRLNPLHGHRYLPYIVVVIDEYSDLAMTSSKESESSLIQLTRKAHIVGIHVILATQRPTKNVITGDLKANFPVQVAFKVSGSLESRIIIDKNGAEDLSGRGDALYCEGINTTRIQVPYISTEEVEDITFFIGNQRGYNSAFELPEYIGFPNYYNIGNIDLSDKDPLFEEAARLIVVHQQGSTSLIQRKFSIGYNRAGRLMDQLEAAGIVGPTQGSNARDVLVADEDSLEQKLNSFS